MKKTTNMDTPGAKSTLGGSRHTEPRVGKTKSRVVAWALRHKGGENKWGRVHSEGIQGKIGPLTIGTKFSLIEITGQKNKKESEGEKHVKRGASCVPKFSGKGVAQRADWKGGDNIRAHVDTRLCLNGIGWREKVRLGDYVTTGRGICREEREPHIGR